VRLLRERLRCGVELAETRRIACAALQYALAGCVLVFYSKSLLGATIRAMVGA
jgi:hypothetical protein